jgi:hypothetical protein
MHPFKGGGALIKTACIHTPFGRLAMMKENRREKEYYDDKGNIKFKMFIQNQK